MGSRTRQVSTILMAALVALVNSGAIAGPGASTPAAPRKVFFADPSKGSTTKGDGSAKKPWGSLQSIIDANLIDGRARSNGKVGPGDLIYLMSGNHGDIGIWGPSHTNADFITIQAGPSQTPIIKTMTMSNCEKWVVRGVTFENIPKAGDRKVLLNIQQSNEVIIDANKFRSQADVRKWSPRNWATLSAPHAIFTNKLTNSTISKNIITNVENGIAVSGDSLDVSNNSVDYFANDGIQFTASNSIISRNRITNHYGLWNNGYHHDGMQGYTAWDERNTKNVVVDGNTVLASTGAYPLIPPVSTGQGDDYMQGIVIFQGDWDNLTVTNNVVGAAGFHGLSLFNLKNSSVLNNTIISQAKNHDSWLGIFGEYKNVVVRNNIATTYSLPEKGVLFDSNLAFTKSWQPWQRSIPYTSPEKVFTKWSPSTAQFDFRLAKNSYAIGRGSTRNFAPRDIVYVNRKPQVVDMGAYVHSR
ncbi:hypothetical protein [Schlesneria sp. DSM 10557]|uniref:hypothetical protein n=1 Tax=Schlesneria sp. DSM 10557 TaxID=3044399 RepID=UPI0035A04398